MITKANLSHKLECVELIKLAMDDIIDKLDLDDERLGWLFALPSCKSRLSYENISLFLNQNGEVLGAMGCYDAERVEQIDAASGVKFEKECFGGELYVDFLAVFAGARGVGVGSALLGQAELVAKDFGLKRVSLITNVSENESFYSKFGFKGDGSIMCYGEIYKRFVKQI